jgi:hypothetical protein
MMEEDMFSKSLALALLGTALISAPALAQTSPPAGSTAPSSGPALNTGNWMTQAQPDQWRASKLRGVNVYNDKDEKIGDINELLVDNSGKVQAPTDIAIRRAVFVYCENSPRIALTSSVHRQTGTVNDAISLDYFSSGI